MAEELTHCDGCGGETKTIFRRCPVCGYVKRPGPIVDRRPRLSDQFFDFVGDAGPKFWVMSGVLAVWVVFKLLGG